MKTKIKKEGDTWVVSIAGKLDYESQQPFREDLEKLVRNVRTDSVAKNIVFNLDGLEFVGSSGISSFVQTIKNLNQSAQIRPRFCNVGSEFKKVFRAFDEDSIFEYFDSLDGSKPFRDQ
jgi:anti-anti-sigma factor